MWQGHLIRPVPSEASPLHQPPRRRVHTPTPDGLEPFLWASLVLSRARALGHAQCTARPGATHPQRLRSRGLSHFDRGLGLHGARPQISAPLLRVT